MKILEHENLRLVRLGHVQRSDRLQRTRSLRYAGIQLAVDVPDIKAPLPVFRQLADGSDGVVALHGFNPDTGKACTDEFFDLFFE